MNVLYLIPLQLILLVLHLIIESMNEKRPLNKDSILYIMYDEFLHIALYLIIMMPFIQFLRPFLIGAAASVLIDIDHIIGARSARIDKMISLPNRPSTHSLTYAVFFSLLLLAVFRSASIAGAVFAGIAIHLLRDMITGKTLIFFPVRKISYINKTVYAVICIVLIVLADISMFLI